jgi:hypothetical protein
MSINWQVGQMTVDILTVLAKWHSPHFNFLYTLVNLDKNKSNFRGNGKYYSLRLRSVIIYYFQTVECVTLIITIQCSFHSATWGPLLTYTLRANFDPRVEVVPQRWILTPGGEVILRWGFPVRPSILLNSRECSPLGVNEWVDISPRGQISPLGAKFTPGGQRWS